MIELRGLSFGYSGAKGSLLYNGLSCVFGSPGLYEIYGGNGSGKTTLLDIIGGFKVPSSGFVLIDGIDICTGGRSLRIARKSISYLPAGLSFPPDSGIGDLLKRWNFTDNESGILEALGLQKHLSCSYGELSQGYRSRVGIALCSNKGKTVLFDEPFRNQDDDFISGFPDFVSGFLKGKTVVITACSVLPGLRSNGVLDLEQEG